MLLKNCQNCKQNFKCFEEETKICKKCFREVKQEVYNTCENCMALFNDPDFITVKTKNKKLIFCSEDCLDSFNFQKLREKERIEKFYSYLMRERFNATYKDEIIEVVELDGLLEEFGCFFNVEIPEEEE